MGMSHGRYPAKSVEDYWHTSDPTSRKTLQHCLTLCINLTFIHTQRFNQTPIWCYCVGILYRQYLKSVVFEGRRLLLIIWVGLIQLVESWKAKPDFQKKHKLCVKTAVGINTLARMPVSHIRVLSFKSWLSPQSQLPANLHPRKQRMRAHIAGYLHPRERHRLTSWAHCQLLQASRGSGVSRYKFSPSSP